MVASYAAVPTSDFEQVFGGNYVEVSSSALGGRILDVSDEFFAEASNLLKVGPAPSLKGQFGPKGALFDGWESRRHNPTHDWAILRLGAPSAFLVGFDIDTANFNGNEAPEASVHALFDDSKGASPAESDEQWEQLLPRVPLGPSSRHLFTIPKTEQTYTHIKLSMYPDGGIARFRVYGVVSPLFPSPSTSFDLAHVFSGGRVTFTSDQHFGVGSNLILPGRGKDMGDGWETRRSRQPGHRDWVIINLGHAGLLEYAEIDTAHFKGNFPDTVELHAAESEEDVPPETATWTQILPRTKLGPHRQHFFQLENVHGTAYTHVKMTIWPDGGVKRLRIVGRRALPETMDVPSTGSVAGTQGPSAKPLPDPPLPSVPYSGPVVPALPLTPEAFAPYGQVLQSYADLDSAPKGTKITECNQGSAQKFHHLASVINTYPESAEGASNFCVYKCSPLVHVGQAELRVRVLERHKHSSQAFMPLGRDGSVGRYLVIVALNGPDDEPDLSTLRAFVASTAQGINYAPGIWHHPMLAVNESVDFACLVYESGSSELDCNETFYEEGNQAIVRLL